MAKHRSATTEETGEEINVTGAKRNFEGGEVILPRKIVNGRVTLTLREESAWPDWDLSQPAGTPDGPVSRRMID